MATPLRCLGWFWFCAISPGLISASFASPVTAHCSCKPGSDWSVPLPAQPFLPTVIGSSLKPPSLSPPLIGRLCNHSFAFGRFDWLREGRAEPRASAVCSASVVPRSPRLSAARPMELSCQALRAARQAREAVRTPGRASGCYGNSAGFCACSACGRSAQALRADLMSA